MTIRRRLSTASAVLFLTVGSAFAAIPLSTTTAATQNFDGIGATAAATLPADWKVDKLTTVRTLGTYGAAGIATALAGGANLSTTASNGIYNFGSGTTTSGADRAIGFLSSGSATQSGNLYAQFVNNSGGALTALSVSYDVEKYRGGSNGAGFSVQLYYSLDGAAWTPAGTITSFPADASNSGFSPAPGSTVSISNANVSVSVPNGSNVYLAWNYSVTSGTTTTNAQALSVDNVSVLGVSATSSTNPFATGAANPASLTRGNSTLLTVNVTPGSNPTSTGLSVSGDLSSILGLASQTFFDDGTNGDVTAGDNIFSFLATVPGTATIGAKSVPVTVTDSLLRTGSTTLSLVVHYPPAPFGVVISQIYGGGGNSGATLKNDFVELYNLGTSVVSLNGWSVQYAAAGSASWAATSLSGSIAPGGYYLIQEGAGTGGTLDLPTADATGSTNMSASDGKVALVTSTAALSAGCPVDGSIADFAGYGGASCFEGSAAATTLSATTAALRKAAGAQDTDNNSSDFTTGTPNPRNSIGTGPVSVPLPPAGVNTTGGNNQVALSWSASTGATSYNVKRSIVSGSGYVTAGSTAATSFTDTSLTNGTTYYYVVTATNTAGESAPSTEVSAVPQAPPAAGAAKIYFIDIGQGAGTLIVSPTGKSLLVDGGPDANGTAVKNLLDTLHISTVDFTVLTHYHIDHDSGLTAVLNAGRVAGVAYDNGDDPSVQPPNLTGSTGVAYTSYVNATHHAGVTRRTIQPGDVIDLGGGMQATCLAVGGRFIGGGSVPISNTDLNSESISLLVEYNNFDFLVSGDMTGGGSTSTATTPDVETYAAQLAGDVDVVQLDHHGSTTASNQRFLNMLKAEVAVAQAGSSNTFGHPNRETVNKFLNTPDTTGETYGGALVPPAGHGTVFYEMESPVSGDSRVTLQAYVASPTPGQGTIEIATDGTSTYTVRSFSDPAHGFNHTYNVDGASAGLTTTFPPTVIPSISPVVPLASDTVTLTAKVTPVGTATLVYSINGVPQSPVTMACAGNNCTSTIAPQPDGARVGYTVTATAFGKSSSYSGGYFSGTTPISALRPLNALGEPLYIGYPVRVQGTITAGTGFYNSGANNDDYLQDATGGINIFRTTDPSTPAMQPTATGDVDSVAGLVGMGTGRLRIEVTPPFILTGPTPYTITRVGGATPVPESHTLAQIAANPEALEGKLVSIANCHITGGSIPGSGSLDGFLSIDDGSGVSSIQLKIDKDTDIFGMATPAGSFTLIGTVQQDQPLRPFFGAYNIAPRSRTDMGGASGTRPATAIADVRVDQIDNGDLTPGADTIPDLLNQNVHVHGIVTTINFRPTGTEYYIQDDTAGVDVFSTTIFPALSIGDYVDVTGSLTQFNGLTEINVGSNTRNIVRLSETPPFALPQPASVTVAQLGDNGAGESFEGRLVRLDNVRLAPGFSFPAAGATANVTITDGTSSVAMRILAATNVPGTSAPAGSFSVIGVVGQFDSAAPFDSGYQVFPRSTADIIPTIVAAPASIAFGAVTLGQSTSTPVTITNNSLTSFDVTLVLPGSDFSVNTFGPLTVPARSSVSVTVSFQPTSSGAKLATLTINSSAGNITIGLSGSGTCPTISLLPATLPNGTFGTSYSQHVTASGGLSPYTFTTTGTLPSGISVASDGTVSGTSSAAGTFTFSVNATDANLCSGSASYTVTVDPASPAVSWATPAPITYGTALGNAQLNATSSVAGSFAYTPAAGVVLPAGDQTLQVVFTPADKTSYTTATKSVTVHVNKAVLHVTADNQSRVYGDANQPLTSHVDGLVNGDTSGAISGAASLSTAATEASSVGTYSIVTAIGSLHADNYDFDLVNGTLTVSARPLTATANGATRLYGSANPSFDGTLTGAIAADHLTVSFTTAAVPASSVGRYDITPLISDPQGRLTNYSVTLRSGVLNVTPASLTISAVSAARTYGAANLAFGVLYSGFVLGETPAVLGGTLQVASPATAASVVGTYPIIASGLTSGNYAIEFVPGALTVLPAVLHVVADDKAIVFGDPLPQFTATITGFVLGQTTAVVSGSPAFSTSASSSSLPGDYDINVAAGSLSAPNYGFDFTKGTLHIGDLRNSLQSILVPLRSLIDGTSVKQEQDKLNDAIKHLTNATDASLWLDGTHGQTKSGDGIFTESKNAVIPLLMLINDAKSTISPQLLQPIVDRIVSDLRLLAVTAVNDAAARGANVSAAQSEIAKGDSDISASKYESGIEHYRNAWASAIKQ